MSHISGNEEIVTSIAALGDAIMTEDPKIDLTFSKIILTNGEKAFVDKVNLVKMNVWISYACKETGVSLIIKTLRVFI